MPEPEEDKYPGGPTWLDREHDEKLFPKKRDHWLRDWARENWKAILTAVVIAFITALAKCGL